MKLIDCPPTSPQEKKLLIGLIRQNEDIQLKKIII